jgi:hypothetical protein
MTVWMTTLSSSSPEIGRGRERPAVMGAGLGPVLIGTLAGLAFAGGGWMTRRAGERRREAEAILRAELRRLTGDPVE